MMSGQTVCGFRDSAYLYFPLFKWIDAQWAAGEIPLWNPYCNFGMPVIGDGSSSVFYPGKLIFLCRFLTFPSRYGIYLAIHVLIAAGGTYWLAKTFRANRAGATLAAIGYGFGGSVIFQVTNVIFLVSAAWLPFAVACVWKMARTRKPGWAIAAGLFCALMILGGDPQMVYHVGLIAVATILFEVLRVYWRSRRTKARLPWSFACSQLKVLLLMVLVTSSLAAIQILPTYEWSKRSERTNPNSPANLYQLVTAENTPTKYALLAEPGGTIDHTYQFSREPWSMGELFWPNFSGKLFPVNQRWTSRYPGTDRVWMPSIYMGVLVSLFGFAGFRLWGRRRRNVWLTWIFLFFCIASFGWYGIVWLLNEFQIEPKLANQMSLGPQVGGLYWLMQVLLPKYFVFRYPAKLFVIASLALAVLAGVNLRRVQIQKWLFPFSIFGFALLMVYRFIKDIIPLDSSTRPDSWVSVTDPIFGPHDGMGCLREVSFSLVQALAVIGIGLLIFGLLKKFFVSYNNERSVRMSHVALVVVTILDIMIANHWMLGEVPATVFESPTEISQRIKQAGDGRAKQTPLALFRHRHTRLPVEWERTMSKQRLSEVVQWQRESLYPKHHLEQDVTLFGSFSSVWPIHYEELLTQLEREFENKTQPLAADAAGIPKSLLAFKQLEGIGLFDFDQFEIGFSPTFVGADSNGESPTKVEVTSFSINQVGLKFDATSKGTLMLGTIAEPGWTAEVTHLENGTAEVRPMGLDSELERLVLKLDQAGGYEIKISYMPISFVIGVIVSLLSLVVVILWGGWSFIGSVRGPQPQLLN